MTWEYTAVVMMALPGLVCLWITWGQQRALGPDGWGPDRPREWSNAVRRAQLRAGVAPDGLWGPRCVEAGLRKPLSLRLRNLWRRLAGAWQRKGLD